MPLIFQGVWVPSPKFLSCFGSTSLKMTFFEPNVQASNLHLEINVGNMVKYGWLQASQGIYEVSICVITDA